jgi:predicted XRE-type DNA-binding protein
MLERDCESLDHSHYLGFQLPKSHFMTEMDCFWKVNGFMHKKIKTVVGVQRQKIKLLLTL